MNGQCGVCHQLLHDGSPALITKCGHRYHHRCLSSNGEINDRKCPSCANENMLLTSVSNQKSDETNYTLQKINPPSTSMTNKSMITDSSFEWSCHHCTYHNSSNLTRCDICNNLRLTDSTDKYQEIITSHNKYDPSMPSFSNFISEYTTASISGYEKSDSSVLDKKPNAEQISTQLDELPRGWECEVCTYENENIADCCSVCNKGQRPYTLTQSISNHNTPQIIQLTDPPYSFPVVKKNPIPEQISKQQDKSPVVWKCEMCTYENESAINLCSMCYKGKRPHTLTQMASSGFSQSTPSDSPELSPKSYSIFPKENPTAEPYTTISSRNDTKSTLSVVEKQTIVFIPDLPFDKSNSELEQMIRSRLSNDHHANVTKVECYSNISVGIVYVANETDKTYLVKNLRSTILDPQTNTIIQFVENLELISYLVRDPNMKTVVTSDQIAHQWQKLSKSLSTIDVVAVQFPNIFKIISHSLDELLVIQNIDPNIIKNYFTQIYLNANCSFFEDLPQNITESQIRVAINAQIGGQYDQSSLYIQYNKDAANAIVLNTNAARKWTHIHCISLNNQYYMKKTRLAFRLVLHSIPPEIPTNIIIQDEQFKNSISHNTRIGDKLIIEVKDKSIYDKYISTGVLRIRDVPLLVERFNKLINDPDNMEINAETWYETEMLDYQPELKQFIDNPQHPIFKYKWNNQSWLEQFNRYEGIHNDENDKKRRLLRVTVMLNTIGILWRKSYTIETKTNKKEIKLNLLRMRNIIYNHRSKLENKKEISIHLSIPFSSTIVKVVNEDCLIVYQRLLTSGNNNRPVLLNMANAETPGGGYRRGAGAQEENLFRRSNYYLSLDMELDYNKQADRFWCTANCEQKFIGTDQKIYPIEEYGAIYTSGITVFRDIEHKGYAYLEQPIYDVCSIASAAYARPELKHDDRNMLSDKFAVDTRKKIENFFAIAYHHGHDCLVLSAFGCGAFRNPPTHIAMIFKSVIEQYAGYFKQIYFSIIDDHNTGNKHNPDGNFRPFKSILDDMTFQPSKRELDVNMISGPFRVLSKNQGKLTIDQIKILDLPPCKFSALCHDLNDTQHCQSYSHPPLCPQYESCDQSTKDHVHLSSFIHRIKCSYGGICKLIKDEKHLRSYNHPEYCSDRGYCVNMDKNHLIKFRHVDICKDRMKCLFYLRKDADHCRSYRHCLLDCPYGGYCVNFHDKKHLHDQAHPFRTPCPFTPFACKDHIEYLRTKIDYSSNIKRSVEEHCILYSHVCPFGRQCHDKSELHSQTSIHIPRNVCSNLDRCSKLSNEEHLNSFTHPKIHDIRFVCKDSNSQCRDRWNRDHILHFRHTGNHNHIGIARCSGLNKNINFVRNQNQLIKTLSEYIKTQKWKLPSKDNTREITEWIQALQPVHRCNKVIFESILVHGNVMSRKYMDRLRQPQFVANAVDQHPKVRKILSQKNNTVLQDYVRDFIRTLVTIEFDKHASTTTDSIPVPGMAAVAPPVYRPSIRPEQTDMARIRESQMKMYLTPNEINTIRKHALEIADASLKLHANKMGIGHVPDELFGTNDHVFSILGPNLGHYYGDIFIVFKHEIMFHPDSNFSIQAATTYGQSGNAYKNRPWLKDPGTMNDRVQYFHRTKLHCSIHGYDYAAALELMALTGKKKNTMDVSLKDVQQRWMQIDPHEAFEAHLPQLIPLDYIDHIYIPKNLFYSLSTYTQQTVKETFHHNLTITEHNVNLNPTHAIDPTHLQYEKYVHDEVRKKIANNNFHFHRGTIITLPPSISSITQYICIPMSISQSFYQYQANIHQNDTILIYWQALGGDMMLTISEYQIDSSRDQSRNPSLICYIADISSNKNNINDYREPYSYITNSQPFSHDMLVQGGHFKAKSDTFHLGCNIYDYITYCLKLKRKTGEVTLTHAGANSIYNHQIINYTFERSELDVTKLDYIHVSACHRVVPIRNLVIRHEPIEEYHPSFDKDFKEGNDPLSPSPKSSYAADTPKKDQEPEEKSFWGYIKEKFLDKDDTTALIPCRDSIHCLLQYSFKHSESHNKKYSHPCQYSELCRKKSDHSHLEHIPHKVSLCQYDKNCRERINPIHRAQYRHTDLPDFLIPCRNQTTCSDKTIEHRIKYSHGERISSFSPAAARRKPDDH